MSAHDVQALKDCIGYLPPYSGGQEAQDAQHVTDVALDRLERRKASRIIDRLEAHIAELESRDLYTRWHRAQQRIRELQEALAGLLDARLDYVCLQMAAERGCGCMCHVGSGSRTSCEHCSPRIGNQCLVCFDHGDSATTGELVPVHAGCLRDLEERVGGKTP